MDCQIWIYRLTEDYGCGNMNRLYPNFKMAYEEIERRANGNPIIDCGDKFRTTNFEILFIQNHNVNTRKFSITRELLTIFPKDEIISPAMIDAIKAENEKRDPSNYRLISEVI